MMKLSGRAIILLVALQLISCEQHKADTASLIISKQKLDRATAESITALGRQLFFDTSLSASGRLSCASCHDPDYAYSPANNLSVQLGGADLKRTGQRAVPSLAYTLNKTPRWFRERAAKPQEQDEEAHPPFGGFTWDGRVDTLHEQAGIPLLDPNEMANDSPNAVAEKISKAVYAEEFRRIFGKNIFDDTQRAFQKAAEAIEYFELNDKSFHPYSSKYDAYLDGKAQLTGQELHGLELFNDRNGGNCAFCHPSNKGADGSHPLFTNYQFEALGVPRNPEIPANKNPAYYDFGLCGPMRSDQPQNNYCGMFKTPTLRNVARRGAFFHNGYFHKLEDVLRFYVQRDTHPEKWYPRKKNGGIDKFNDLPKNYRINIDIIDTPLDRKVGETPAWSEQQIRDVTAFINTLTDGYAQ